MGDLRAVTFDHWDTLVHDPLDIRPRQLAAWEEVLAEAGTPVDPTSLADAFEANWAVFEASWASNVQHGARESAQVIAEHLGLEPDPALHRELVDAFGFAGKEAGLQVADGAGETLTLLEDAGLRLGIICDVGLTSGAILRERLDGFGLLRYFDHWSFSDEVGCFKPFAPIFEHAMDGLGVEDPAAIAHVGDGRRTDVAGALAMGMVAVRATWFADRPPETGPEATHVARTIGEVPALLGIS